MRVISILILSLVLAVPAAVARPVDVNLDGDAQGDYAALTLRGNSSAGSGVAVSGIGESRGTVGVSGIGGSTGTAAASGLGDSDAFLLAASGVGDSSTDCGLWRCLSVSGVGDARSHQYAAAGVGDASGVIAAAGVGGSRDGVINVAGIGASSGYFAASGVGESDGIILGASGIGGARGGHQAVAGYGDAESCREYGDEYGLDCIGVAGVGDSRGLVAVSGVGDSTTCEDALNCFAVSLVGDARGETAATLVGNATSCRDVVNCVAITVLGDANGSVAVAVLGRADAGSAGFSGTSANDCGGERCVDVRPSGDAEARFLAVTGSGDAQACRYLPACVALSADGDATGAFAVASRDASGSAAVAGRDADGYHLAAAGQNATACPVAVNCAALSVWGVARGGHGLSVLGTAEGDYQSASAGGDSRNTGATCDALHAISPGGLTPAVCATSTSIAPFGNARGDGPRFGGCDAATPLCRPWSTVLP